jgi:hypothetical protein
MTAPVTGMPADVRAGIPVASLSVVPVSQEVARLSGLRPASWTTREAWIYITEEIRRLHGPQLPGADARTITDGFCDRFGIENAVRIARAAFEVYGGMWHGAPVTIKRFQAGHDDFFARPLLTSCSQ